MRALYIDDQYLLHVSYSDGYNKIETNVFDGECDYYIEGFRYIPKGQKWVRRDGEIFEGEVIFPAKDLDTLLSVKNEVNKINKTLRESYVKGVNSV